MNPEDLRQARDQNPNVAYQTFIKHVSEDKDGYFCFFEGKDAPYYNLRVKQSIKDKTSYPINCKGKKMVLKAFELIKNHSEYDKYSKGYFVDKDFDESLGNHLIFETPTYSIENFYIKPECVVEILKNDMGFYETEESFINAISLYKTLLNQSIESQSLFNAWYCCLKEKKIAESLPSTNVNLDDKFPRTYYSMTHSSITCNYDLTRIKNDYKDSIKVDDAIIYQKLDHLKKVDRENVLRGKYLLEFLYKFIQIIITDSNTTNLIIKRNLHYQISLNQMISMYSQYAITPLELIQYLSV